MTHYMGNPDQDAAIHNAGQPDTTRKSIKEFVPTPWRKAQPLEGESEDKGDGHPPV